MDESTGQSRSEEQWPFRRYNSRVEEIANILMWIVVALTLALIARAFVVEAFRIPTGSMADTLRGDHYHIRCPRCGYVYDVGADIGMEFSRMDPLCPNCEYELPDGTEIGMSFGDRIFVLKSLYQFTEPKRWDVVVFKNPTLPVESYIKRMIALPGETVQIIDGDIYIDGRIQRKPPRVQREFWKVIYDNNFKGFDCVEAGGKLNNQMLSVNRRGQWQMPMQNKPGSEWNFNDCGPAIFELDDLSGKLHRGYYDTRIGKDFYASYAYNDPREHRMRPFCTDTMVRFKVMSASESGMVGVSISKYRTTYTAGVGLEGSLSIKSEQQDGQYEPKTLAEKRFAPVRAGRAYDFQFAVVDHLLILRFGNEQIRFDLGTDPDAAGRRVGIRPEVTLLGSGKLTIADFAIYRDMYYMDDGARRATLGKPFKLEDDQFFVCGDNSPSSLDSRLWTLNGIGNNGLRYRKGVVPRDYLVGKAFFIYWANAFKPAGYVAPIVPNLSEFNFIAGGSDKRL